MIIQDNFEDEFYFKYYQMQIHHEEANWFDYLNVSGSYFRFRDPLSLLGLISLGA